MKANIIS